MKKVELLDCTLRDGGYLNDWEFGHEELLSIFERQVSTNVEFIEVGFLDDRRPFDINRSIFPFSTDAQTIYGKIDKKNATVMGMIDFGTCRLENICPCSESYLDGIRVIFKEHKMYDAIAFCKQLKELGYIVFAQMVSATTYTDEKLEELMGLINDLKPYAVSIVDTYGLMHQENVMHIFEVMDKWLSNDIAIGYHSHNNFQMGYANCREFLGKDVDRTILVDGTLYGMGKSAGNAPIELLAMHMNDKFGKQYDVNQMLEAIEVNIIELQSRCQHWGYSMFFYISSSKKCHPNYVDYLVNKKTLSIKSVNEILDNIIPEKKLLYDKKHIEELYLDYQKEECDDSNDVEELKKELTGKSVIVFGPGKSMIDSHDEITTFVENEDRVCMSINYVPKSFDIDYLFLSNAKRYVQISTELKDDANKALRVIGTSNVTKTIGEFSFVINYSSIIDETTEIPDNSLCMLLRLFKRAGVTDVALAGFDGYSVEEENYFDSAKEYDFAKEKAEYLNDYVSEFLRELKDDMNIRFITKTQYKE